MSVCARPSPPGAVERPLGVRGWIESFCGEKRKCGLFGPAGSALEPHRCSSLGGLVGNSGRAAYHATKHGVIGLTKSAALEYGSRGVRFNAVCPGTTPMVDGGEPDRSQAEAGQAIDRLGTADEIAQAVLWLCSDGASYITGIALPVDGGYTAA